MSLLSILTRSLSIEDPTVPISPENLVELFGYRSNSGEIVTADRALRHSPVWAAVGIISSKIGTTPMYLYQRSKNGKSLAKDHDLYHLIRYKPNEFMTARTFRETLQAHALLFGNGYGWIIRDPETFKPVEIIPMSPVVTQPIRENGKLLYITQINGEIRKLNTYDVLHIHGLGFDGTKGYDVVSYARETFGHGLAIEKYSTIFFKNSAVPAIALEHPAALGPEAAKTLREQWDKLYSGLEQKHRTAVLEEGMKAHTLSYNARDSQLIEALQQNIKQVANIFRIPPHKLGDSTRNAYNSLEQENQSFLDDCLNDWFVTWEEEARDKLLTEEEKLGDSHFIEYSREDVVRADFNTRSAYFQRALGNVPWLTVNEARAIEGKNPLPEGDKLMIPTNNYGSQPQPGKDQKPPESVDVQKVKESASALLADTKKRVQKRLQVHFEKSKNIDEVERDHGKICREMLEPVTFLCRTAGMQIETEAEYQKILGEMR